MFWPAAQALNSADDRARELPPRTPLSFAAASARVDAYVSQFEEGYFPPLLLLARLSEEVGEVARVLSHENGKTPKPGEAVGDLELELADALFVMLCMANQRGLSLERGFRANDAESGNARRRALDAQGRR